MISIVSAIAAIVISVLLTVIISTAIAGKAVNMALERITALEESFVNRVKEIIERKLQ